MQKITVHSDVADSLTGSGQKVLIYDDKGRELGFFQPVQKSAIELPLSIEEIEKIRKAYRPGTGKTTEEVLRKWES
jgi:hypothetical protein